MALRLLRERRGWNQQELADRAGSTKSKISTYETGTTEPTLTTLDGLLLTLGSSWLELSLLAQMLEPAVASLASRGEGSPAMASVPPASTPVVGALRLNLAAAGDWLRPWSRTSSPLPQPPPRCQPTRNGTPV